MGKIESAMNDSWLQVKFRVWQGQSRLDLFF